MSNINSLSITLLIFLLLHQSSICANECIYKVTRSQKGTNITDASFLANYNSDDLKKQKCFSLSNSDVFNKLCCYNKSTRECIAEPGTPDNNIDCPKESQVTNNCGMASFYQPVTPERCTEISLVDGFCCFVKTKTHGTGCVRQKEIDEDDKNAITDDIKDYLKGLQNPIDPDDIDSIKCEGNWINNYFWGIMLLLTMINIMM